MNIEQALQLLFEASTKTPMTKESHLLCEQAFKLLNDFIKEKKDLKE